MTYGNNLPTQADMVTVNPNNRTRFRNIFYSASDDISKGLSTIISSATDGHWGKWAALCRYMALNSLLVF